MNIIDPHTPDTTATEQPEPWSLPNTLTVARIILIIPFAACYFVPQPAGSIIAFAIFAIAAITDFADGYLARKLNQHTRFGMIFDPVADKAIVLAALMVLIAWDRLTGLMLVPAIIIAAREVLVSGLREHAAVSPTRLHVSTAGKWKTTLQLIAIAALLLGPTWSAAAPYTVYAGLALLWGAALLSLTSAMQYAQSVLGRKA